MLYLFDELESFSDAHMAAALERVGEERRKKTLAYIPLLNRELSLAAGLLLRYGWRQLYGKKEFPPIEIGPDGKPFFAGGISLHFNLSHCRRAVACVLADFCVGVDVESYREYNADLARKVLNENEQGLALNNPERFAGLWTMKESYVKYTGVGLTDDLPGLLDKAEQEHVFFKTFYSNRGYACSVCGGKPLGNTEPVYVGMDDLIKID